ncbi:MAG: DUF2127 domain-containing protein [Terracidiphilus sp.]|jgi:uncharacterized membrane protein (DUF2068 family)
MQVLLKDMTDSPSQSIFRPKHHNQWLVLIAAFKLAQALLFVAIGVGVVRLLHKDVADVLTKAAEHLRFTPESRLVNFILKYAPLVNDQMLRRIGVVVFFYAALDLTEGIGLYLEKVWAEFLTLAITASFLPWEAFEIYRRITLVRVSLLTVNAIVLIYLLKLVMAREKRAEDSKEIQLDE